MAGGIKKIETGKTSDGRWNHLKVIFGPHYFLELCEEGGRTELRLGATHHGFRASADEVNGELEVFINKIREIYPASRID